MNKYFNLIYQKSLDDYYKYLEKLLINNQKKFIITVNPETLMLAQKEKELRKILLNKNNSLTPDGISVIKKAKKYGINISARITGIEISEKLLEICNKHQKSLYLFGSKKEIGTKLLKIIKKKYPNITLLGFTDGYSNDKDKEFQKIVQLKPDVCLVALGIPHQELLINKHIDKFEKGIFIGVGGSFDVISGAKKRAPKILIKLNLEWLYRIIKEPKRLKRFFLNNIIFMFKK